MLFGNGSKPLAGGLMIAVMAIFSFSAAAAAGDDFDFQKGASIASALAQSRAQNRILLTENKVPGCAERDFVSVEIVKEPAMMAKSAEVKEKKWQEQWTVSRCGEQVGYLVFFTEIGIGGTFFSIVENE
ncbi:MAG: hypothetical protein O3A96_15270 [Proteobacteria bacterium]|nr:hypothetical protein [Pseudomonadota bacterium]